MPKFVNTFSEGLDKDTVPTSYKNTKYYDARNFNIVVAEDLSSATLTNNKGIEHIIKYDNGSTTKKIVGIAETSTTIVLFIQTNTTTSEIHEISKTVIEGASSIIDLNLGTYLVVSKAFDFGDRVEVVAREETPLLRKIYWVDGVNPIRFCNLATDSTELAGYSITQFEIVQEITFSNPIYSKLINGSLTAGVYQYAYCLYDQNAGQSTYSPLSQFIQITETGLTTDSALFSGSAIGVATTSGIEITINDSNTNFNYIRVVALFYSSPDSIPEITIIYEGNKTSNITIAHTGTQNLGSLSLEEAIASPIILIPKTISSKYNYLFVGNSQEQSFDVDFDARTYRFNSSRNSLLYNADLSTLEYTIDGTNPDYDAITINADCANKFNDVSTDETRSAADICKFKSNGTALGGEGLYVNYRFKTHFVALATTSYTDMEIWKTTDGYTNGLGGYANPYENNYVGYQRDEIYRFGIVFFNSKGQSSFVKWIGDIRMPKASEYAMIDGVSETMYGKALGLNFVFNFNTLLEKYPDIVSYRIVRTKRNYTDSTVIDSGYIGHLYKDKNTLYWQGYSKSYSPELNYPGLHSTVDTVHSVKDIVEYICAETNYNKNNYSNYDRLDIYDGTISSKAKRDSTNTYDYNNVVLTKLTPSSTFNTYRDVEDATLFRAQRSMTAVQNLSSNFDGFSVATRSHVDASGSRGYKGTTLLLKLDSDITGVENNTCPYVLRRQYIQPYGGYSNSAITNSTYYPCSPIYDITTTDIDVFGGDTYISIFEYNRTLWADGESSSWDDDRYAQIIQCIVESKINLNYTVNHRWSYYDDGSFSTNVIDDKLNYSAMWETSGVWEFCIRRSPAEYFTQDFNLYTYNPVYSLTTGKKSYIPKPINFTENTSYNTRVYVSEKKINGETLDSWTQFLVNNYIDLDNQFGELTRLLNNNNTLFYFQEKGFGVLPIAEREVVSTNNGSSVSIGTGGVLERFDYITTGTGTTLPESIVGTDSNVYWIDNKLNKICQYGGDGFRYISDTGGMFSYMNSTDLSTVVSFYHPINKEIHFSFPTETLIYNEYTRSFISLSDTVFDMGIHFNGSSYLFRNTTSGYTYTSGGKLYEGDYGQYSLNYKDTTSRASTLDLIINPARQIVTVFDVLELSTEVLESGVNQVDETFTSLRVRNNYQDTGTIALTPGTNIIRRFRTWRFNGLRNSSDDGRIIDNYSRLTLSFTNVANKKLVISDIQSTIRPLNIK